MEYIYRVELRIAGYGVDETMVAASTSKEQIAEQIKVLLQRLMQFEPPPNVVAVNRQYYGEVK